MKFLVDQSLQGLAKWLRLCGFDAAVSSFSPHRPGLPAPVPGTYLVTRKAGAGQAPRDDVLVLAANDPDNQLAEIFRRLKISRHDLAPLSRCGACNDLIAPTPREQALGSVPDHVFHTQAEFFQCPRCGRFYWPGSHPARIAAKLQQALEAGPGGAGKEPPMTSETANRSGQVFSALRRFLKIFILNLWRRLLILGRYLISGCHHLRLRRAWRLLGKRLHRVVEGGETNPMITEEVQDRLTRVQIIQAAKDRQYQAMAALREKIQASRAGETAPPEAEPSTAGEAGPEKSQD